MRYRMLIEYDGTGMQGWQIQPEGKTVQGCLEEALHVALRYRPNVVGSGRTDAGVHARGQVAHFDTPQPIDVFKVRNSLNGLLPGQVAVLALDRVEEQFHARYDARRRSYLYHLSTERHPLSARYRYEVRPEPDFERMNRAAHSLLGCHDCSAFCRVKSETKNRVCTLFEATWEEETYKGDWVFKITADRFLHGMVRTIVGTLLDVGHGKRPVGDVGAILRSKDRTRAGPAAPAHGLVLEEVAYEAPR